jgi:phytoene desaturase
MIRQSTQQVAVVGAGLGGLAAACTLAARGYQVTVFEQNTWSGGKAAVLEEEGFRFDMGPTILTLPSVLKRIFAEAKRPMEDYLDLVPLDPQWRCIFDDGEVLDLVANVDDMYRRINEFSDNPAAGHGYRKFLDYSAQLHEISERVFFWRSVGSIKDMFQAGELFDLRGLKDVLTLRMGRSVAGTVRSFIPDARVSQLVDHFTQYVGSSPDASPAVLCGIAHMQTQEGIWYPMGGTRAVPVALKKLASDLGVVFREGSSIEKINKAGGKVVSVETAAGEVFTCDAVVSNADCVRMHEELLTSEDKSRFLSERGYEPACSGVVLYLGLKERYPQLLHHNFVFSRDPHEEFQAIYQQGIPAPDPTCYVCAPAVTEPGVAPPGGEALYILVHTPYLREGQDWSKMLPEYRQVILDKLKKSAGLTDIEDRIVYESALTPQSIQDRYRVLKGAIYGLASHGKFMGAFKPANRYAAVKGLYLAGGSAHPGPGMPMVMMSGWIAADSLDQDRVVEPVRRDTMVATL